MLIHIIWDILKIFVSLRKCLGTNISRTSLFTTPDRPKSCEWAPHKCWLPSVCTYHMDVYKMFVSFRKCIGTDTPQISLFTTPECHYVLLCNLLNGDTFGCKKGWASFKFDFQVFAHIPWDELNMFVSFRKCLGTDTPGTSPFTTPACKTILLRNS